MDILIYAKLKTIEHKFHGNIQDAEDITCYWTGKCPKENNLSKIEKVYFSDGNEIYAYGNFLADDTALSGEITFTPLWVTKKKQPKKPPTRGWCYINKDKV